MKLRSRLSRYRSRMLATGVAASAVLVLTLGAGVTNAGASSSAFCSTMTKLEAIKQPSSSKLSSYKTWLKTYEPYFAQLASEAPNASVKRVMTQMVTLMKYEENTSAAIKLEKYIAKNEKQWSADWEAYVKAAVACVTSVNLP